MLNVFTLVNGRLVQQEIDGRKLTDDEVAVIMGHEIEGVVEALEHWKEEKGLPLPAQFLLESGRLVAQKDMKLSFRLASLTPIYVWNGPNSEFERRGLEVVMKTPEKPFTGFYQQGGVRYFQGIYADRAVSESCVSCHNAHVNSPRRDYKLNDIMGGVIVTIPISEAP